MTDAEIRLAALLAADEAPAHDRIFEAQVTARVDQRRSMLALGRIVLYAACAVAVVGIALSSLVQAFGVSQDQIMAAWPFALSLVITLACLVSAWRYLKPLADWRVLISWI